MWYRYKVEGNRSWYKCVGIYTMSQGNLEQTSIHNRFTSVTVIFLNFNLNLHTSLFFRKPYQYQNSQDLDILL